MSLDRHRAHHFYRDCGHTHKRGEFATVDVPGLGQTCAAGRVYTACAECCVVAGTRSVVCLHTHAGKCNPCPRRNAAERTLQTAGRAVPVRSLPDLHSIARW